MNITRQYIGGFVTGILLCAVVYALFLSPLRSKKKMETTQLQKQIKLQSEIIDSLRQSNLSNWMGPLLNLVLDDLKRHPDGKLEPSTIAQISNLCYAANPYPSVSGDSISIKRLSPERGQLLLVLSKFNIDTSSYRTIFEQCTFEYADLRGADMRGAYLRGINLNHADLQGAHLQFANLSKAQLSSANLWGAHLAHTNFQSAHLKDADLSWAELSDGQMQQCTLTEANLYGAQVRRVDLTSSDLQWTDFTGAFLSGSRLDSTNMFRSTLMRAQADGVSFVHANLTLANLFDINLKGADLRTTNLQEALVNDEHWLDRMEEWNITGGKVVRDSFQIHLYAAGEKPVFQLKRRPSE